MYAGPGPAINPTPKSVRISPVTESDRAILEEMRGLLLHHHKVLLDWQRREFEQAHGRLLMPKLLQTIVEHEDFSWLRAMSGLIVQIDEALEADSAETPADAAALLKSAGALVTPVPETPYAARYHAALQALPEAVMTHAALVNLFKLRMPDARKPH